MSQGTVGACFDDQLVWTIHLSRDSWRQSVAYESKCNVCAKLTIGWTDWIHTSSVPMALLPDNGQELNRSV